MKLIDADALMETIGITKECKDCARNGMRGCSESSAFVWACESITEAPTIDAVQVVRCKDCAKSRPDGNDESVWLWCRRVHGLTRKNDFCPYGERRCDETKRN